MTEEQRKFWLTLLVSIAIIAVIVLVIYQQHGHR
jgi:hypothetical protein